MSDPDGSSTIGWREWIRLPQLTPTPIKAKVDTGARTSTLHAFDIEEFERDGAGWVRFGFHPIQRDDTTEQAEAPLLGRRTVRPSSGRGELRPVIRTEAVIDGRSLPIELTLTRRDAMGFRMLLGRRVLREGFVVDPRRSYRTAESKEQRRRARKERAGR